MTIDELERFQAKKPCFYTRKETDEILTGIGQNVVVDALPAQGIENFIYLVPTGQEDTYMQHIWTNDPNHPWQEIGPKTEKLINYVTEPELKSAIWLVKVLK